MLSCICHSSLPNEGYENKYFQDLNRKLCVEEKASNDSNPPFKENEKEGGEGRPQFGDKWKVPMLGGPWKVSMFGGP
jgi:hypothetical protein